MYALSYNFIEFKRYLLKQKRLVNYETISQIQCIKSIKIEIKKEKK